MHITGGNPHPIPQHLVIDDWYSEDELKRVWKELEFYTHNDKFESAIGSGNVATNEKDEHLGEQKRIHLDQMYTHDARRTNLSDILNFSTKVQSKDFHEAIKKCSPMFSRTFLQTNLTYSLLSYYENNHYYAPHHDIFFWTVLIWLYKEPKAFSGGDFIFADKPFNNYKVECKNNRLIAFPSYYLHGVETVNLPEDKRGKGLGRYTITHFFHYGPMGDAKNY